MPYDTFDDFARRGSPQLLGVARPLVADRHAAEDLTQETLIRAFRAWPSIRVGAAVDSYADRTLVMLAQRRDRRGLEGREVPTATLHDESYAVDDEPDLRPWVLPRLPALPTRHRVTLVLRFYADLGVDATAKAMGCRPRNRSRVRPPKASRT
jgi:RNA polymerase sigma factor (sigma-70 family)